MSEWILALILSSSSAAIVVIAAEGDGDVVEAGLEPGSDVIRYSAGCRNLGGRLPRGTSENSRQIARFASGGARFPPAAQTPP